MSLSLNLNYCLKKGNTKLKKFAYEPDNEEMVRINTKIMILTQNFIYDTKRFISC